MGKQSEAQEIRDRAIELLGRIQAEQTAHAENEVVTGALAYMEAIVLDTARGLHTKGKRSPVYESDIAERLRNLGYEDDYEEDQGDVDNGPVGD